MFNFRAYFWGNDVYINEKYRYSSNEILIAYLNDRRVKYILDSDFVGKLKGFKLSLTISPYMDHDIFSRYNDNVYAAMSVLEDINLILSISLDTIYTKNFSKFSLLPHKYPRSVSGVDICAGASCGGTQRCMITPPFFSRRHAAYCRADSPIVPITHKVTPNKRF